MTASDVVGNVSAPSGEATALVTGDTAAPSVVLTSPASGATIAGSIQLQASASDDGAVAGVRFRVNGTDIGVEDTSAPYWIFRNSTTVSNGAATLTAVARDMAGNTAESPARA